MATITKRGKSWVLNWRENGKQWRKSLGAVSYPDAQTILKAKELELETGHQIFSSAPLFKDYADDYLEWYAHEFPSSYKRTESIIRLHLLPKFQFYALDTIDIRTVEQWKSDRLKTEINENSDKTISAGTVIKELRVFKAMLNRAEEWQIISSNPIKHVKTPKDLNSKPPLFYTAKEMQKIYTDKEYRFVWQLLANTGLRRSEAMNLKKEHVLEDRIRVVSETGNRTKSGKWRDVPLNAAADEALKHLSDSGHILPRINKVSLSRAFDRTLGKNALEGSLHCLRHTFCSHLVMAGVPLRTVQILAGHAHYSTTEKYAHLAPEHLQNVMEGFKI